MIESPTDIAEKAQTVLEVARALHRQQPDWVTFFREVLGLEGLVRQAFPTPGELADFEQSAAGEEIQQMLKQLRENTTSPPRVAEPTQMITVRLPRSLHHALREEAQERRTSLNKLCISKLLQAIDEQLVPNDGAVAADEAD
ncbi:MAG: toxin-antitoxin system HicB family antitoxin [Pirellulales bacterium]|nr:toxin-antitoxin system HicB family antitoxin [Pirellulales bacterium]